MYMVKLRQLLLDGLLFAAALMISCGTTGSAALQPKTMNYDFVNVLSFGLPGMNEVEVSTILYHVDNAGNELYMDIYKPPAADRNGLLPVLVQAMGFPDDVIEEWIGTPLKEYPAVRSWGRLAASVGMASVAYQTTDANDFKRVMAFLDSSAEKLGIDRERIGVLSVSANPPTAIAYLLDENGDDLSFAVFSFALMTSPDGYLQNENDALADEQGWYNPPPVGRIPANVPIYLGIAGLDYIEFSPDSAFHFAELAEAAGAKVTVDYFEEGLHSYDHEQHGERSTGMIIDQLNFMADGFGIDIGLDG
jgi:hypothetical protein